MLIHMTSHFPIGSRDVHRVLAQLLLLMLAPVSVSGCTGRAAVDATASGGRWEGEFSFILVTDPQLGMFTNDKGFTKETELLEKAIAHANRLKPAFVLVCGDMINKPGDETQIAEFHRIATKLDKSIPIHLVAGNHDLGNVPTQESLDQYRKAFGKDWYSFDVRGCHFIVIDTTLVHSPAKAKSEEAKQWAWLKKDLETAAARKPKQIILFEHHPLFLRSPNEPADYHNLPKARRAELIEMCRKYNISAVFAGHLHRCNEAKIPGLTVFAAGPVGKPLAKDPSGLCIVNVYEDRVVHHYYGLDNVPERIATRPAR